MRSGLILILFSICFSVKCLAIVCEEPWKSFHRNCILFVKSPMLGWFEAQKKCEESGGSLISINSFIEGRKLVIGLSRKGRITKSSQLFWWVGLQFNRTAAKWRWTDGDDLSRTAIPWKAGEPNNKSGQENCGDVHFSGKLSDKDCNERKPYICERIKITPAPTTSTTSSTVQKHTTQNVKVTTENEDETTTAELTTEENGIAMTTEMTTTDQVQTHSQTKTPASSDTGGETTQSKQLYKTNCSGEVVYDIEWPHTDSEQIVRRPCPRTDGFASWKCDPFVGWVDLPDLANCSSANIRRVDRMLASITKTKQKPTVEDVISIAANLTESILSSSQMSVADIKTSTTILQHVTKGRPDTVWETETIIKEVMKAGNYIFRKTESSENINSENKKRATSELLQVVEQTTQTLVDGLQIPATITTKTEKIYLSITVFNVTASPKDLEYNIPQDGTRFFIPQTALQKFSKDGFIKSVFMTHYDLGTMLRVDDQNDSLEVGSNIITASLGMEHNIQLSTPATFTMQLSKVYGKGAEPLCSFWDFSQGNFGRWSQEGCYFVGGNSTHVTCKCNHLTNFAILMDISGVQIADQHMQFLKYITYIGCVISIVCLALSWITFQCVRSLNSDRNSIHKNLVFCLFAAEIIFILGIDRTDNKMACAAVAVLLHFFFLSSFTWMFLEGVHIVILLKQVFDTAKTNMKYYYLIGYGISITIVGATTGIDYTAYGTDRYCWLTGWFVWSFTGPVAAVILTNTCILVFALSMVCRHSAFIFTRDKNQKGKFRAWIQGAIAIEVLLGSTWVFGYLFINETTVVMAYIFTVLNSLQGLFIFIFHCLLNKKIRFEYKKLAHVRYNSQSSTKSSSFKKKDGSYEVYVST